MTEAKKSSITMDWGRGFVGRIGGTSPMYSSNLFRLFGILDQNSFTKVTGTDCSDLDPLYLCLMIYGYHGDRNDQNVVDLLVAAIKISDLDVKFRVRIFDVINTEGYPVFLPLKFKSLSRLIQGASSAFEAGFDVDIVNGASKEFEHLLHDDYGVTSFKKDDKGDSKGSEIMKDLEAL